MFNAIRQRIRRFAPDSAYAPGDRDARIQLRLPSPYGGEPWVTATVALSRTSHGQGETLCLQAQMDGCLWRPGNDVVRPGLDHASSAPRSLIRGGRAVATSLLRGVVHQLPTQRLTARRCRSWLDVKLSTAPLDAGADALMPERLRDLYGGSLVRAPTDEPRIDVWTGPAGGRAGGLASLVILQLNARDFRRGGREPGSASLNLSASMAQVIEPAPDDDGTRGSSGAN